MGNRFSNRHLVPFRGVRYGFPSGISYVPYPYLDSLFYEDMDDSGYNEASPMPYAAPAPDPFYGYTQPQEEPYEPQPRPAADFIRPTARHTARPEPEPAIATTLIFKDGRPPEKIDNYIATRSTVTVIDGPRHHDIPVADLDLPATIKANSDAGAGFQLPSAP